MKRSDLEGLFLHAQLPKDFKAAQEKYITGEHGQLTGVKIKGVRLYSHCNPKKSCE